MNKRSGIESKRKIIDAAMDVFSRQGYAKASIREIAKNAGISTGGIYLYFRNKEELYKSLINEERSSLSSMIETTISRARTASEALSDFLTHYIGYAIKHREFILLHIRELGFTFGMDERRQFLRKQALLIEKIIQKGIATGEFEKQNAREVAKIIMGSLRGLILSMALDEESFVTPNACKKFLLDGLIKKK